MPKIASGIYVNRLAQEGRSGRSVSRSASSGRFVSKAAVTRWPGKTTTERVGGGSGNGRTVNRSASSGQFVIEARAKRDPGGAITHRRVPAALGGKAYAKVLPGRTVTAKSAPPIELARQLRSRRDVAARDYLRLLRDLVKTTSQVEIARRLGVTQPSISQALKSAGRVPDPRDGFSGADPYEIAQRYAAGELSREQLVEELSRWEYRPHDPGDGYDWTTYEPGEWDETVGRALDDGLLDDATYRLIQRRVKSLRPAG